MKQWIDLSGIFATVTNLLEELLLSLVVTSRQILPVVVKVHVLKLWDHACNGSPIWHEIKILKLKKNMRLNVGLQDEREFAQWQLDVGHGLHTDQENNLQLQEYFKCQQTLLILLFPQFILEFPKTLLPLMITLPNVQFWPVAMMMWMI